MNQNTQLVQENRIIREFQMYGNINEKISLAFREFVSIIIDIERQNYTSNPNHIPEPVRINLNSGGGYCTDGVAIISAIRELQSYGIKVHIHIEGMACSMAVPISVAADIRTGDNLFTGMIHGGSLGMYPDYITKQQRRLEFEKRMGDKIDDFIIENSNITKELLDEYAEKEYWFDYDEALNLGIITDDIYAEEEPDVLEVAINTISSMKKSDIINYVEQTQQSIQTKLETENKKNTKDKIIINVFEEALVNIDYVFEELSNVSNIKEVSETTMIIIYNIINPLIAEEEEGLDEE